MIESDWYEVDWEGPLRLMRGRDAAPAVQHLSAVSPFRRGGERCTVTNEEGTPASELLELLRRSRPAWMKDAACHERPDVNFFPQRGETSVIAKRVCAGCLVLSECRAWAFAQGQELHGVWGGLTARQRRAVRLAS
jgi:WhiB family redox-sensing transcriptional regulator